MRIAVWHNLPSGGGKRALFNHVKGLLARGHTLEAWCPPTADRRYAPLADLIPEHVVALKQVSSPRAGRTNRFFEKIEPVRRRLAAVDQHCRKCAGEIEAGGFDVVLASSCRLSVVPPLAQYLRTPSVLYLQEPGRSIYEAGPRQFWMRPEIPSRALEVPRYLTRRAIGTVRLQRYRAVGLGEWTNVREYAQVLVNSAFSRESVLRAYSYDSRVCYLGTDTAFFRPLGRSRRRLLVGLGEIRPRKNLGLVVESVALLAPPRPSLVWVANTYDRKYRNEITDLARRRGVRLEFRLLIGDRALRELLNIATAMVYTPRLEPFGFAPVEAAACGLPVIGTAEGGIRESVVDGVTGILVEHDATDIAAAITRLLDDSVLAAELGREARKHAESRFSLEAAAVRLEGYLERVAAE